MYDARMQKRLTDSAKEPEGLQVADAQDMPSLPDVVRAGLPYHAHKPLYVRVGHSTRI